MKQLLLALLLVSFSASSSLADSPEAILKDYRKAAYQALERVNQSLEKAGAPLISKLIKDGDVDGAEQLTKQIRAKIADEAVSSPHASAVQLFSLYDDARAKALEPVQKASIARIESEMKTAGGPKLETLTELKKVRAEIESGVINQGPPQTVLKTFLRKNKIPVKWGFFLSPQYPTRYGTLYLNDDGTLTINAAAPITGTWKPTSDPTVLAVELKEANAPAEKAEMTIKGKDAVVKAPSRVRYFKAD